MELTKEQFIEKVTTVLNLSKELSKLGYCDSQTETSRHFSLGGLSKLLKLYSSNFVIKNRDCDTYPYEIQVPELKIFAIGTKEEMVKARLMKTPKGYSRKEKFEFIEMKSKLIALEEENNKLKSNIDK